MLLPFPPPGPSPPPSQMPIDGCPSQTHLRWTLQRAQLPPLSLPNPSRMAARRETVRCAVKGLDPFSRVRHSSVVPKLRLDQFANQAKTKGPRYRHSDRSAHP